jgi:hypothetical protein
MPNTEATVKTTGQLVSVFDRVTIDRASFFDMRFRFNYQLVSELARATWFVWVEFWRRDLDTGEWGWGRGATHVVHGGATESAVAKTLWVAVKAIVEHELMHAFKVDGKSLFDPHASLASLLSISEKDKHPDSYALRHAEPDSESDKYKYGDGVGGIVP